MRLDDTKGAKHRNAKFSSDQIAEIRRRHAAGEKPRDIVKDYPTTVGYIYQLTKKNATRWR